MINTVGMIVTTPLPLWEGLGVGMPNHLAVLAIYPEPLVQRGC